jgi:UDP-galactopyranose mutase
VAQEQFQPVGTVNYPNDYGYTRISEFKHITGQKHPSTSVVYEYPCAEGDPYYPVPRPENAALYKLYEAEADAMENVSFVGRLATYKYYNMDQVVGQALAAFKRIKERHALSADASSPALQSAHAAAGTP